MLCKSTNFLIKFVIDEQNIYTSKIYGCLASYKLEMKIANRLFSNNLFPDVPCRSVCFGLFSTFMIIILQLIRSHGD